MFDDDYGYEMEAIEAERLDADLLQAQYEAEGRAYAREMARGNCQHSWQLGRGTGGYDAAALQEMRQRGAFPDRPSAITAQADLKSGEALCLDCGTVVDDVFDRR
jgi:hypothetical protein